MSSELDSNPRDSSAVCLNEREDDQPEPLLKLFSEEKKPMSFLCFPSVEARLLRLL